MTQIWSVNAQNDIFTRPGGRLSISRDLQAVLEQCEHAVRVQLGEMIYDRNRGIDYDRVLFDGSPNLLEFEAQLRTQIIRIPDVISIVSFDAERLGNVIEYRITIQTVFGDGMVTNFDDIIPQGVGINGRV